MKLTESLHNCKCTVLGRWMLFISRSWLVTIADQYRTQLKLDENGAASQSSVETAKSAVELLQLAPWHFRLLVGSLETLASLWCYAYRLIRRQKITLPEELAAFEKIPVISGLLLRVYRSLIAIDWFEQPETLKAFGITEMPEEHQIELRKKHDAA